ncbi:unnamed protein product [Spirodela intermedia]|uniref:Large ribosomal subunit protein uL15/eL18 domain-containing protein n=1 Tax=Spirodela intermedia TaxID=51605 RepID=A0A7I8J4Z3_SPIIN|nr:unnamed protein product [Spirodela intermedia]CAA6664835.1 unnamed protein product [Spirodela intermedia]
MAAALLSLSAASPATASPRVPSSQFKVQSFLQLPTLQCSFLSLCPQLPPLHILNFVLTQGNVVRLRPGYLSLFPSPASNQLRLAQRRPVVPFRVSAAASSPAASSSSSTGRFRLDNLGPQPGSRKKGKRKGRGYAAGQGGSCGFGMRGRSRGMHAGLPKYVPVNLKDIEAAGFQEGDEVSLESLKAIGLINPSGRERKLPLKILGDGEFSLKLNIKARAFSAAAKEKLEAAGCSLTVLPGRKKWVKPSVAKNLARADEYFAKKRAAAAATEASAAE